MTLEMSAILDFYPEADRPLSTKPRPSRAVRASDERVSAFDP